MAARRGAGGGSFSRARETASCRRSAGAQESAGAQDSAGARQGQGSDRRDLANLGQPQRVSGRIAEATVDPVRPLGRLL